MLMDRPPPRGAPWELVWSAYSQLPYLQKGRSHAHVKWRLCDRPRYGPMDSRATLSLDSEGPKDLRAIEALCLMQGAHVVHQFSTPSSRKFHYVTKLFKYGCQQGLNQCQVTPVRKHGCAPTSLVNPPEPAPVEGKKMKTTTTSSLRSTACPHPPTHPHLPPPRHPPARQHAIQRVLRGGSGLLVFTATRNVADLPSPDFTRRR